MIGEAGVLVLGVQSFLCLFLAKNGTYFKKLEFFDHVVVVVADGGLRIERVESCDGLLETSLSF